MCLCLSVRFDRRQLCRVSGWWPVLGSIALLSSSQKLRLQVQLHSKWTILHSLLRNNSSVYFQWSVYQLPQRHALWRQSMFLSFSSPSCQYCLCWYFMWKWKSRSRRDLRWLKYVQWRWMFVSLPYLIWIFLPFGRSALQKIDLWWWACEWRWTVWWQEHCWWGWMLFSLLDLTQNNMLGTTFSLLLCLDWQPDTYLCPCQFQ